MRRLILPLLLVASLLSASQEKKIFKFRAFQMRATNGSEVKMDWTTINDLVAITMGDDERVNRITIFDSNPANKEEFDIISYKAESKRNGVIFKKYGAVDKYLVPCTIIIVMFDPSKPESTGVNKENAANLLIDDDHGGNVLYRLKWAL